MPPTEEKREITIRVEVRYVYKINPDDFYPDSAAEGVSHMELYGRFLNKLHDHPAHVLAEIVEHWEPEKTFLNDIDPFRRPTDDPS